MKNKSNYLISLPQDRVTEVALATAGADVTQLSLIEPFDLKERVRSFTSETPNLAPTRVTKENQLDDYSNILRDPLGAAYTMCISGQASDLPAKLIAARIAAAAIASEPDAAQHVWWHVLTGSYKDELRDKTFPSYKKPKLIILVNLPLSETTGEHATQLKIEKCRDILEMYSGVPRILVTSGLDPVRVFSQKLMYPLNTKIYIPSQRYRGPL